MDYYSERVIILECSLGSDIISKQLGELIHNIADGDRGALAELYKLTNKDVYAFALSILKNIHDAEDVLQDCFVRIYSSAGSYSDRGKPMAWILTITKNLCLKCIRSSQRRVSLSDEEWSFSSPDEFESSADDRIMLSACMSSLNDIERQIVVLHAVSGMKHREIAELLKIPLPTVLSKYNRAIKKLRSILERGAYHDRT